MPPVRGRGRGSRARGGRGQSGASRGTARGIYTHKRVHTLANSPTRLWHFVLHVCFSELQSDWSSGKITCNVTRSIFRGQAPGLTDSHSKVMTINILSKSIFFSSRWAFFTTLCEYLHQTYIRLIVFIFLVENCSMEMLFDMKRCQSCRVCIIAR